MQINRYFECEKINGPLVFLSTFKELPITNKRKLADVEDKTTRLYIKHIACCFINKQGDIGFDRIKLLDSRLTVFKIDLNKRLRTLRKFLIEASALNKPDIVEEIAKDIKDLVNCLDVDFSSIDDIQDLDELCIPELDFNYSAHYTNKLYNV